MVYLVLPQTLYLLKLSYPHLIKVKKILNNDDTMKDNNIDDKYMKENKHWCHDDIVKQNKFNNSGLDAAFVKQLLMLLKIMVPGWRSKEAGLLTCATITLLARTFLSVYVATLEGQIVKHIVLKDIRGFFSYDG